MVFCYLWRQSTIEAYHHSLDMHTSSIPSLELSIHSRPPYKHICFHYTIFCTIFATGFLLYGAVPQGFGLVPSYILFVRRSYLVYCWFIFKFSIQLLCFSISLAELSVIQGSYRLSDIDLKFRWSLLEF